MTVDGIRKLKSDCLTLLKENLCTNLQRDYDQLINLLLMYRHQLTREDIQNMLAEIVAEFDLNDYQEEIITEVSNRLAGFCSSHVKIDW
jgi:nitrate/nitrite-specific signal transduction histidine kinase